MQAISQKLLARLVTTFSREDGQAMSEYGVILAVVVLAAVGILGVLTGSLQTLMGKVSNALSGA